MPVLSEYDREVLRTRLREDTPFWAANCATILDNRRRPMRLVARPWQARTAETPKGMIPIDEALEAQRAAGQPMRVIVLKARKLGFSTWVQAKMLQRVTQRPFEYALTVAHLRSSAGQLIDMARFMYERLPGEQELGLGFSVKPGLIGEGSSAGGARWMRLGDKRLSIEGSMYEAMTAGSRGGARGATPSMIHGSEVAHWEDPDFIVGLLNALPKEPETIAVLESTANGFNDFHERWQRAVAGAEDPETGGMYVPLFYGWQDNPFNAVAFESEQARDRFERTIGDEDGGGDEDEVLLVERFGVSPEQLRWRRLTRDEECGGRIDMFKQEHPSTPDEAFIGSGNPVFSGILIARAIKDAQDAHEPVAGVLRATEWKERSTKAGSVRVPQNALWVPYKDVTPEDQDRWGSFGALKVWEHPVSADTRPPESTDPDGQYIVFVDVAQGLGSTKEDGDYSAIQVVDHVSQLQVACYVSRIAIHDLPLLAFLIATYYNQAWLAPEVNGLGIGVVDALAKDLRYPKLYRRRRAGDDRRQDQREELLGWSTDLRTKPLMEQTFAQSLKDGTHGIRDVATARQLTTFVSDERGRHGALKGSHDDLVMSYMGAKRVAYELKPRGPKSAKGSRHRPFDPLTGY